MPPGVLLVLPLIAPLVELPGVPAGMVPAGVPVDPESDGFDVVAPIGAVDEELPPGEPPLDVPGAPVVPPIAPGAVVDGLLPTVPVVGSVRLLQAVSASAIRPVTAMTLNPFRSIFI